MDTDFDTELQAEVAGLGPDAQRRVLAYIRSLKRSLAGTSGSVAGFGGSIPANELELIQAAIEKGCEQVDLNEW